jgi:hypothetical protein
MKPFLLLHFSNLLVMLLVDVYGQTLTDIQQSCYPLAINAMLAHLAPYADLWMDLYSKVYASKCNELKANMNQLNYIPEHSF